MSKLDETLKKLTTIKSIIVIVVATILMPFITLLIIKNPSNIGVGESKSWISFYGSYFGAIISGLITLLLIKIHINLKDNERDNIKKEFIKTLVNDYFITIEVILKKSIKQIELNIKSEEVVYIPFNSLFYEDSYSTKILESSLSYEDKYEFISLFHILKGLIHLSERNIIMREQQNLLMISNNVNTINSKIIARALGRTFESFEEENKQLDVLFEKIIYPVITEEAKKYVEHSKLALESINLIRKKHILN